MHMENKHQTKGENITEKMNTVGCEKAFHPGKIWLDTEGKRIEAHGGAVWYDTESDTYYLYGENKDHTDGKSNIWTWGIRYYSSKDLYNWKDEGFLVEACPDDPEDPMFPEKHIDRPHIIRNADGRYVMWVKYSGAPACYSIYLADRFTGPYTLVRKDFRPFEKKSGDFDIVKDQDGTPWVFFDADHAGIAAAKLTADCTDVIGELTMHRAGLYPPFVREAPALFERNGKVYMLTSGMTGYLPNPSESAVADGFSGPFTVQGELHVGDETCSSFSSQISKVFKHPKKKDLYIAIADRWVPDYEVSREVYESVTRVVAGKFDPDRYHPSQEDIQRLMASPMLGTANTSIANYVWLPIRFEGDRALIDWKDEWRIDDYQ